MAVVLVEDEQRMLDMVGSIQTAANNPGTNGTPSEGTSLASTTPPDRLCQYLVLLFTLLFPFPLL